MPDHLAVAQAEKSDWQSSDLGSLHGYKVLFADLLGQRVRTLYR
jgi:hypothetical protein